ncbi:MAG: response regulator [Candidatus Omnitrophota bacterium]|nr:response regulator [Candidatus Omnitrophota bacterium]
MRPILVVDDEDSLCELLVKAIERKGMPALKAKNGTQAIEIYKKHNPGCVLLDVKLPDMDGIEVFRRIKKFDPQANVYFVSGSDNKDFKETAKNLGASGYLVKPIVLEDVMTIIKKLGK